MCDCSVISPSPTDYNSSKGFVSRLEQHYHARTQNQPNFGRKDAQLFDLKQSKVKNAAADKGSKQESIRIKLYRNVMRNETCRTMTCIDMLVSEAKQLFGVERTRIFFDLLNEELFHFGSAGAILDFVPNMAESAVRQLVISFFEHACDIMNRLMTLLLSCPESKRLQQMQEQNFISLMRTIIISSLKSEAKEGKRVYSKGTRLIMVDSKEFQRALDDKILEEVLDLGMELNWVCIGLLIQDLRELKPQREETTGAFILFNFLLLVDCSFTFQ